MHALEAGSGVIAGLAIGQALVAGHRIVIWEPASLASIDAQLVSIVEEIVKVEADIANSTGVLVVTIVAH